MHQHSIVVRCNMQAIILYIIIVHNIQIKDHVRIRTVVNNK